MDALKGITAGHGFAFDAEMTLGSRVNGAPVSYEARLDGVSLGGQPYTRVKVEASSPGRTFAAEVISALGQLYVREYSAGSWMRLWRDRHPYVVDIGEILLPDSVSSLTLEGREDLAGPEVYVVSGRTRYSFREATGSLDVAYRIGVEDRRLRQITASGEISVARIYRDLKMFGDVVDRDAETGSQTVHVELTARFSDFGRDVQFETPDMLLGLFGHRSFLLSNDSVLVLGGYTGGGNNNVIIPFPNFLIQTYNPLTGLWSIDPRVLQDLQSGSAESAYSTPYGILPHAIQLGEGCLLTAGIGGEDGTLTEVRVLDIVSDSVAALPDPPEFQPLASAAALPDGKIALVGGIDDGAEEPEDVYAAFPAPPAADTVQVFDPSTGLWTQAASLPQPVLDAAVVVLLDGSLLVIGGKQDIGGESLNTAQVYDPLADTWATVSSMHHRRADPRAALLSDGRVLVVGRDPSIYDEDFDLSRHATPSRQESMSEGELNALFFEEFAKWQRAHAEIYDPIADTWSYTAPMVAGRNLPVLTPLPDGRLLVSGGQALTGEPGASGFLPDDLLATTEVFDPRTGDWSPGPDMPEPRMNHSATVLPDGSVLIVGGIGISPTSEEIIPVPFSEVIGPF